MEGYKIAESLEHTTKMLEDIVSACIAAENRVDNLGKDLDMLQAKYCEAKQSLGRLERCRYNLCIALKEMGIILPGILTNWQSKYV